MNYLCKNDDFSGTSKQAVVDGRAMNHKQDLGFFVIALSDEIT